MYIEPETGIWNEPARVEIEEASNGFVVRRYHRNGCTMEVAKTEQEAKRVAMRLLGKKNADA